MPAATIESGRVERPTRWVIGAGLASLLIAYLAVAWLWGVRFDYRFYVDQWAIVFAGGDPWTAGDSLNPNAYGPVHNLLAFPWALHPLLPKLIFVVLHWALVAASVSASGRRGWTFLAQAGLLVALAIAPLGVLMTVMWGAHDVLVAALCVGSVWCRLRERLVASAVLLAAAVLFKYYPLALAPFLALDGRAVRWRFVTAFVITLAGGIAASLLAWGPSMWLPLTFASGRGAKLLSIFAFLEGPYSPLPSLAGHAVDAGRWSLPAMALTGAGAFALAWWTRMPAAAGATLAALVVLTFYGVGHFQFHATIVWLGVTWLVASPPDLRRFHRLAAAGLTYFATLNGLCVLYALTNRMDDEHTWWRHVVGLPMFVASIWLIGEIARWSWRTRGERAGATDHAPASAAVAPLRSVAVIVPTYREAENLPDLLDRLRAVREAHGLDLTVWVMDDNSRDGTEEVVAGRGEPWVHLVTRTTDRGLSPAVLEGLRTATADALLVMDADLSHPPEKVPGMLAQLAAGSDFVIGSRYVPGGTTDEHWGFARWLNSKTATWLARPLTRVKDPMAGFFALRRATFERAAQLNPVGYKIGLELIVKCGCERVSEVPIHFADRTRGQSKLSLREQLRYIQHLRRLFLFKHPEVSCLLQFAVVGAAGTVVNLLVLSVLLWSGLSFAAAVAMAIVLSLSFNFVLNRRFTFSFARCGPVHRQFAGYAAACALGAAVNYTMSLVAFEAIDGAVPQLAALAGIAAGGGINYVFNRVFVFRHPGARLFHPWSTPPRRSAVA